MSKRSWSLIATLLLVLLVALLWLWYLPGASWAEQVSATAPASGWPIPPGPPVASLIAIAPADSQGTATISGAAGAVEPSMPVWVANLDTGEITATLSLADGSFQTSIFAPPGSWIQVKHGGLVRDPILTEETVAWLNPLPGTLLLAPMPVQAPGSAIPFAVAGLIASEGGNGHWMAQGEMYTETVPAGSRLVVTGVLQAVSPAITPGTVITDGQVSGGFALHRLFDQGGRRVAVGGIFVSTFQTPTGLPVSRQPAEQSPIVAAFAATNWSYADEQVMQGTISATIPLPPDLQPGFYRPRIAFQFDRVPLGPSLPLARIGIPWIQYLPMLRLGDPQPPRLAWTLLTNNYSNASRGTLAREDRELFGLMSHIITQADAFYVPRVDPRTGEPIAYRLEPFLPFVSMADRSLPGQPTIPFHLPSGSLEVQVRHPDGALDTIGPLPIQQSANQSPSNRQGVVRDDGGGRLDDVYQLTTLGPELDYVFPGYGHYVVTMTGTVEDVWGNIYHGQGTYDVFVARHLKLEPGQLPTTPYEVDDAFSPGIQVYPPVPADVEIHVILLPDSDAANPVEYVISGRANRYGYFQPSPGTTYAMVAPGEYRVDVVSTYVEHGEVLWMGSATWGNVVETQEDNPLVVHGRRGRDTLGPWNLQWFFHDSLPTFPSLHTMYPYWSGDVFWGIGVDDQTGGDAIMPAISLQDPVGQVESIIEQRWYSTTHSGVLEGLDFPSRVANDELPLFSTTSDGKDPYWSPGNVDQVGYAYRTSQRPGVRVHETVSEDALGTAYWRFDAEFGGQAGIEGDLPNDLKWEFGGTVFRFLTETNPINLYGVYGSLWVLVPDEDPMGARVAPPFQGATGAVDGGPIMTLKGQPVDIFFMPKGVQPGDVLEVGDAFAFAGHVGPPLDSRVSVTVTSPSGLLFPIEGRANKVGWFYKPDTDFVVEEAGLWTVDVQVVHDKSIPSGGTPGTNNSGGVLGSADGRYHFYAVFGDSPCLPVLSPKPGYLDWPADPGTGTPITVTTVPVVAPVPAGLADAEVSYTIRMPGFILEQGTITPAGSSFTIDYDPVALHQDFPNLDLKAKDAGWAGLADPVMISFLLSGQREGQAVHRAGAVFLNGDEVQASGCVLDRQVYLPLVLKRR